jgi:hypothetical protein
MKIESCENLAVTAVTAVTTKTHCYRCYRCYLIIIYYRKKERRNRIGPIRELLLTALHVRQNAMKPLKAKKEMRIKPILI